ncbi:hypothetical protein CKA53_28290, partial [Pseudomonas aeruginosa]|uniref:MBG domain-containing protein n=1 Tax=Pseudomonas aeruginosa TaxID=287 RepID=UPI000FEF8D56
TPRGPPPPRANYYLIHDVHPLPLPQRPRWLGDVYKTKVYGDADPSLTYQVSGLKNGDTAGAVLNGGGLVRVSGENVGNYAIQQGGLGLVSGNYDLAYQGNNLTITKA